jgi:hypothetical protein
MNIENVHQQKGLRSITIELFLEPMLYVNSNVRGAYIFSRGPETDIRLKVIRITKRFSGKLCSRNS